MSVSRALFSTVLISTAVVALAAPPKDDAVREEMKKLQGTWQVTALTDQSEEAAPADEIKDFTFEFRGDRLAIRKSKGVRGHEMKYTLNPSKKPAWIDIDMGGPIGIAEGIYSFDKDKLRICVVGGSRGDKIPTRPADFKASKREKHSLFVLKKIKK